MAKENEGQEKPFWTRIGSAWETDKGGISISFNALPLGDHIMLFQNEDENEGEE